MTALQASFRGFKFWAIQWTGQHGRRIVEHKSYGREGVETEDTGSDGKRYQLSALLNVSEFNQLSKIVHEKKVGQFTPPKPGLASFRARANIGEFGQAENDTDRLNVPMTFTQDTVQPPKSPYDDDTPTSKKNQAANLYAEADDTMGSTPGNADTQALYTLFQTARIDYDLQVTDYEANTGTWQDVERALGEMKSTGWAVINHLEAFDTYQENASEVISNINRGLYLSHEYVQAIKQSGQQWFKVLVEHRAQDLFTMIMEVYEDPGEGLLKAEEIVNRNDVLDVFYIETDTVLEFPYA